LCLFLRQTLKNNLNIPEKLMTLINEERFSKRQNQNSASIILTPSLNAFNIKKHPKKSGFHEIVKIKSSSRFLFVKNERAKINQICIIPTD
jgi:hypothetical protein